MSNKQLNGQPQSGTAQVELLGKSLNINQRMGVFVTSNPGYAGRSNLPDNLKKLFRSQAMTQPDRESIAQVMLFSQGFRSAETLASKIVPFFVLCAEQLSPQPHYDFGLRALKAVLISAGNLKRDRILTSGTSSNQDDNDQVEQEILIQSVTETIVPKLIAEDVPLLTNLLSDVFPGIEYVPVDLTALKEKISQVCHERKLVQGDLWLTKVLQLYQIQRIQHGLMMVGPAGTGKTQAWQTLLQALERYDGIESVSYVIDPKAMSKEALYGTLDQTTREWNDGLFTHILRKIVDNVRGESSKRHWIIFDGDVDPEWVENLNSVLDDNKLLTLPNGERLNLPSNVRIMFEVEHLKYATPATVSRCGMIWFSGEAVTQEMYCKNYLDTLSNVPLDGDEETGIDLAVRRGEVISSNNQQVSPSLELQRKVVEILKPSFQPGMILENALQHAMSYQHIMDFTFMRALTTLFSLINKSIRNIIEHNVQHSDFPLSLERIEQYINKRFLVAIVWAFTGDSKLDIRLEMGDYLRGLTTIELPMIGQGMSLIDYDVNVANSEWFNWTEKVPTIELETHAVTAADVVVPTVDTIRHEEVLYSWLSEHKPLMLCGPPGSGKTMTLFSALRKLPDMEIVGLNFSSATTPELILKTFEQYCELRKTPNGNVLAPSQIGRWLVLFCDEINLPALDKYGTQKVISFLRQLVESNGYWRTSDMTWVQLERIQFVGACNPPTDPGRVPLTQRFLRHAPLVMVDYPGEISLNQIYGTFNRALLKTVPSLRGYAEALTGAMVSLYLESQRRFTADIQAHYIYSPRELTRWARGIFDAIKPLDTLTVEGLVRIWAHEALRLFQDRLVLADERKWTDDRIDAIALKYFHNIDSNHALARPILFSNWLSKNYVSVDRDELREFVKSRLRIFEEEELDVQLVLFDDVLDNVLRIDRVFRQVQGHALLIGVSGSGKTTLSRFVAWMNGLSIFQIKVSNKYTGDDFDEDLRTVLRRAGTKGEKICFIMDESNVLDSGFLERMNTLLANAEVPGLFEGDEHSALMTACKEGAAKDGMMLDSHEELYRWFTSQVSRNLHVVFTMNPPENGLASRAATSPALFNRCVVTWMGDWAPTSLSTVASELTDPLDVDMRDYIPPTPFPSAHPTLQAPITYRGAVVNAFVYIHLSLHEISKRLSKRQGRYNYITPRHYLDFIDQYVKLFNEKRNELEEQQRHLNVGLDKLRDTVIQVDELQKSLAVKDTQLKAKVAEGDDKLAKMLEEQKQAESNKATSIEIQAKLQEQNEHIAQRKEVVMTDLADAEPAVKSAQESVSNIKKQHLTEVRSMGNPPEAVKLAMESVCTVLGHKLDGWKTVQGIIRRDDFISSIVNFDTTKQMSKNLSDRIKNDFMSRPKYNFEDINRASKACGPLVRWVIAQVHFAEILDRVGPLRNEVKYLEDKSLHTQKQASAIIDMIKELEESIEKYKGEYAGLISEQQAIKSEIERVQKKVERSKTLLNSLSSEQERWETSSKTFESQMSTIVGDVLLSAAFLAYAGFFDQQYREGMWNGWSTYLSDAGIKYKQELSFADYLSTADDRLSWQSKSLPADTLCTENAIMMKRFNRFPLIIDPSGQASNFLINEYKGSNRKLNVTSFSDNSFLKQLESAMRFGNPILVQDVEFLDPIINPILNKEIRRTGGRILIRIGNQDIDYSPTFNMFLMTRDPSVEFSPDICSRVTFVNFTMTRSSLQSQSLDQVLKSERPDVDAKRTNLLKLQGEFRLRLHFLEKALLQALNQSTGNILDDDKVIETLETLKKEAADVTLQVKDTDTTMAEVDQVTSDYQPLASACSSVFFVMDQLNLINHFYQFSLKFFLDIFDYIIRQNPNLNEVMDYKDRLNILTNDLFLVTFQRTSRSLLHVDHVMLAVLLAQVKLRTLAGAYDEDEFDFFIGGGDSLIGKTKPENDLQELLNDEQASKINLLSVRVPSFSEIKNVIRTDSDKWRSFLLANQPELDVPLGHNDGLPASIREIRELLIIKCLRPDRLVQATSHFVNAVFNTDLTDLTTYNFQNLVQKEVGPQTPVALCSVPGYDASYRVDNLVSGLGIRCNSVAMGSPEGFRQAEQAITQSARSGQWVLLKNVHLAPGWLTQVEKKLQTLNPTPNFRLFLTMETNPLVPINILRQSRIIMNEPPPGIKANILETLRNISPQSLQNGPVEKMRLYFLLSWFHAVIQERLRFCPLGWSKLYEFNDSDQASALKMIDTWTDRVAKGRSNVDPSTFPWEAIRTLLKESIYGGKVDRDFDQKLLNTFVDKLFTPDAYEINFQLVSEVDDQPGLNIPEGTKLEQFIAWAEKLPEREPTTWLNLPITAEKVIAVAHGSDLLGKLRKMKSLSDDDETVSVNTSEESNQQPAWMRTLMSNCQEWLELLPKVCKRSSIDFVNIVYKDIGQFDTDASRAQDPIFRFFKRESEIGRRLYNTIRCDLDDLISVCKGEMKQTNHLRKLMNDLTKGTVPSHWKIYRVPNSWTITQWVPDFSLRLQQIQRLVGEQNTLSQSTIWFGGLFFPGSYLTATRQESAHRTRISLEELQLELYIDNSEETGFAIDGLYLEGADYEGGKINATNLDPIKLNTCKLKWTERRNHEISNAVSLPVYLNLKDREVVLFSANLSAVDGLSEAEVTQRSICLSASI
ncbi:hypothetical protein E3Q09_01001 [Wallemia mellicola]|nr:hypothetical protein E3Q09_01001 [Wallemia mellicola]